MQSAFEPIVRLTRLLELERAQLFARGPHFCIYHRFWQPGTICTPREAIAEIWLWHRKQRIPLPLSCRSMLLFDYLARHQHLAQSAAQIAAGLNVDPFTRQHGRYSNGTSSLRKTVSRTGVKQQIMRLRVGLRRAFCKAGLNLDPTRVLLSEETTINEVRYRLRVCVIWEHSEF